MTVRGVRAPFWILLSLSAVTMVGCNLILGLEYLEKKEATLSDAGLDAGLDADASSACSQGCGATDVCDEDAGVCVACRTAADCPTGESCVMGPNGANGCYATCTSSTQCPTYSVGGTVTCCNGLCTDTVSDAYNCSACGSSCVADGGNACCNSACTNTAYDTKNCGQCGSSCTTFVASATCSAGACVSPPCNTSGSPFGGGNGAASTPFLVCSNAQLSQVANYLDASVQLAANLNLASYTMSPIGNSTNTFNGTFNGASLDGGPYQIANMALNLGSTQYVGLFGGIGANAVVENVALPNANVTGLANVGALAGVLFGNSSVQNCSVSGTVTGGTTGGSTGGLIGYTNSSGSILNCSSSAAVTGGQYVGGLIGYVAGQVTITSCSASGNVSSANTYAGGLIGLAYGYAPIAQCYATGSVTGGAPSGGLVGAINHASVANSFATGAVNGFFVSTTTPGVGGLIGEIVSNVALISYCYATGSVSAGTGTTLGGLIGGCATGTCLTPVSSYWDKNTTGQSVDSFGDAGGRTTAQMLAQATYVGWNFSTLWNPPNPDAGTYPTL